MVESITFKTVSSFEFAFILLINSISGTSDLLSQFATKVNVTSLLYYQSKADVHNKTSISDVLSIRRINANLAEDTLLQIIDSIRVFPYSKKKNYFYWQKIYLGSEIPSLKSNLNK